MRYELRVIFLSAIFLFLSRLLGLSQCPSANFSIPSEVCIGENLTISNESTGGNFYEWDFNSGDLAGLPVVQDLVEIADASVPIGLQILNDNNWTGFVISQSNKAIVRLAYNKSCPIIIIEYL